MLFLINPPTKQYQGIPLENGVDLPSSYGFATHPPVLL
jgi:hypothetical protein